MTAAEQYRNKARRAAFEAGQRAHAEGKPRFAPYSADNRSSAHFRRAWLNGYDEAALGAREGGACMTAERTNALAVIDELIDVPVIECQDDQIFVDHAKKARDAVEAVFEEARRCCGGTGDLRDLRQALDRAGVRP